MAFDFSNSFNIDNSMLNNMEYMCYVINKELYVHMPSNAISDAHNVNLDKFTDTSRKVVNIVVPDKHNAGIMFNPEIFSLSMDADEGTDDIFNLYKLDDYLSLWPQEVLSYIFSLIADSCDMVKDFIYKHILLPNINNNGLLHNLIYRRTAASCNSGPVLIISSDPTKYLLDYSHMVEYLKVVSNIILKRLPGTTEITLATSPHSYQIMKYMSPDNESAYGDEFNKQSNAAYELVQWIINNGLVYNLHRIKIQNRFKHDFADMLMGEQVKRNTVRHYLINKYNLYTVAEGLFEMYNDLHNNIVTAAV